LSAKMRRKTLRFRQYLADSEKKRNYEFLVNTRS
jgi:hypothetical protein